MLHGGLDAEERSDQAGLAARTSLVEDALKLGPDGVDADLKSFRSAGEVAPVDNPHLGHEDAARRTIDRSDRPRRSIEVRWPKAGMGRKRASAVRVSNGRCGP